MRRQGRLSQVEVPHRRADVPVAEQALDRMDVDARFEQMRREAVPQRILTLLMNRPPPSFTTVTILFTANT